jgi:glycerol-3-phosphate acyltransferase PlsY
MNLSSLLLICFAYLLGALPIGYWYARFFYRIDITQHGSGNIGASNCARILGGPKHFFIIFTLDALKSFLTLLCIKYFEPNQFFFFSSAATLLIGNGYSLFLHGRGGKGVSTYFGILLALNPFLALSFALSWGIIRKISRSPAGASISASFFIPGYAYFLYTPADKNIVFFLFLTALWILYRHKKNISLFLHTL